MCGSIIMIKVVGCLVTAKGGNEQWSSGTDVSWVGQQDVDQLIGTGLSLLFLEGMGVVSLALVVWCLALSFSLVVLTRLVWRLFYLAQQKLNHKPQRYKL